MRRFILSCLFCFVLSLASCDDGSQSVGGVNSVGMNMISIAGGTYNMGSSLEDLIQDDDEGPQHSVTISPFLISATEITQAQYEAVMGTNPSGFGGCSDCPVETVSWDNAIAFCNALSEIEGYTSCYLVEGGNVTWNRECNGYRLPTEAEWEYMARAGSTTAFANGGIVETECNLDPDLDAMGWYCGNAADETHPVARKLANAWDIYDAHGNVWEWVWDWYGSYTSDPATDPVGPESGIVRIFRGGGWLYGAQPCRSANRSGAGPDEAYDDVGFRVAKGTGESPAPTPTAAPTAAPAVSISSFYATPSSVVENADSTVAWTWIYSNIPDPTPTCSIDNGVGAVESGDSTTINISSDTTYILTCANAEGSDTAEITVTARVPVGKDIVMLSIPGGAFTMGSPAEEPGYNDERPQHSVTVDSFLISATVITQEQYEEAMGVNPSYFSSCGNDCPAETVSWYEAVDFCNALSAAESYTACYTVDGEDVTWNEGCNGYRLPTEAEWEYAARAGSATAFADGGITSMDCALDPNLDAMGWYCGNAADSTHPAGQKEANAWGLYDMHGNVWEWVWDWYDSAYYSISPSTDPTGPASGSKRVNRGGDWASFSQNCRSANRGSYAPEYRGINLGFRIARSSP